MEGFSLNVSVPTTFCFTKQAELFIISGAEFIESQSRLSVDGLNYFFKVVFNASSSNQQPRHSRSAHSKQ